MARPRDGSALAADGRIRRRLIAAGGMLIATSSLLIAAAGASAYVYWSSYDSNDSKVGRANLDGSNVKPGLVKGIYYGAGVASDGKHVFWGESGSNPTMATIGRATIGGRKVNHAYRNAATYCGVFGVRATADDLFWLKSTCSPGTEAIDRAPKSNPSGAYTEPGAGSYVCGFDVDAKHVYWSESHYIARAPIDVGHANHRWLDVGSGRAPCAVAVNGGHVYWTNSEPAVNFRGTTIGRAKIDGSESSVRNSFIKGATFNTGVSSPSGIAVDRKHVYWTNQPAVGKVYGSIGRATLGGKRVDQAFVPHVFDPFSLDVDGKGP
ncbi:MAG: hypothetical protein ACRDK1_09880 [Solirubrobacterales bacterium]